MFLSIVIPVYNAAGTIRRCLDSIWSQGLPEDEYEVICVDDCSSDNSAEVIKSIAKEHPQLRLVRNKENLRAGGARNHGVKEARGEYILFIDADDYYHPGGLKRAFDYQKKAGLDILMCDFARHTEEAPNNNLVHNFKSQEIMTGRKFLVTNSLPYGPCKYMFRKSLMIDNDVYFTEKVSCEDVDWTHKIAFFADTMQYLPMLLNHYILLPGSQTGSGHASMRAVSAWLMAGKRVTDLTVFCHTPEEKKRIQAVAQQTLRNGVVYLCALFASPVRKATIIKNCISPALGWTGAVGIAGKHPYLYGIGSTAVAPVFRMALKLKRKFFGR